MVSNQGQITTLDVDASINKGLEDGTDKMHSGILKVLQSFTQGDMCISHGNFAITDGGTYTQYNLYQPIQYLSRGEFTNHTSSLNVAYTSTPVQDPVNSRYDWVLLDPAGPTLEIVEGTAGATPLVSDITAGFIPIALVHITAGTNDDKFDYAFQTFTLDITKKSLSIMHGGSEVGSLVGDANGITLDGLYKLDNINTGTIAGTDKILFQDADDSDIIKTATINSIGDTNFSAKTTDDLSEGSTNLYYRKALVEAESTLDLTGSVTVDGSLSVDGGAVFNDNQTSVDFRVESDNNEHMLFVDGGLDAVGIKASAPNAELHVEGVSKTKGLVVNLEQVVSGPPPADTYNITDENYIIVAALGPPGTNLTLNLPSASTTRIGQIYRLILTQTGTGSLSIDVQVGDTLADNTNTPLTTPYELLSTTTPTGAAGDIWEVICLTGTEWLIYQI